MQHQDRSHHGGGPGGPIDFADKKTTEAEIDNLLLVPPPPQIFEASYSTEFARPFFLFSIFQIMSKETHENVYLDFTVYFFAQQDLSCSPLFSFFCGPLSIFFGTF